MELQQFIHDTLVGIARGVADAKASLVPYEASVNPVPKGARDLVDQPVAFDVAVTAGESTEGKAEGGIKVMSVGIGGGGSHAKASETVSRIQFTLRVALPRTEGPMVRRTEDGPYG